MLIALASGYLGAIAELEAIDARLEEIEGDDIVGACRLLLAAR